MSKERHIGIDIGTNMLISASLGEDGSPIFKMQRDAFFKIVPKSKVNSKSIEMALTKRAANFIFDSDGNCIVVGNDALEIAIERNAVAKRPMRKGIISPKEKDSLPMLKLLIESLIGKGEQDSKIVYSVPARPVDSNFDIVYHTEMIGIYLREMGYCTQPIGEAFAISLSELLDDNLTGVALSFGAGLVNISVVHQGDPLIEFSLTKAGDYIDQSVANALDETPSVVQFEKESGIDLFSPQNKMQEAISVYYNTLISYILENISFELNKRKKDLPVFRGAVPIIISGGLVLAGGFLKKFETRLNNMAFPIKIKEVRLAENPMTTVANGCLLAAQL
jgi:actin-like ATPase involved in cell morphogenesis